MMHCKVAMGKSAPNNSYPLSHTSSRDNGHTKATHIIPKLEYYPAIGLLYVSICVILDMQCARTLSLIGKCVFAGGGVAMKGKQ